MDQRVAEGLVEARVDAASPEPTFDPYRLVARLRRRRWTVLGVLGAVLVVTGAILGLIPPRYTATATVMLDARQEKVVDTQQVLPGLPTDSATVDTQVEVLRSRGLAETVVYALNLDQDPEFRRPGWWKPSPSPRQTVIEGVQRRLTVKRQGLTYVIGIAFSSTSPQKAARIADAFADRYLAGQLDAKFAAAHRATAWLGAKLDGLRVQVETAEAEVQAYQAAHGLMTTGETGATITQQEISNLNTQFAAVRAEQAEAEAKLTTARMQLARGSTGEDLGEALSSNTVSQLRQQRATISGQVAELSGRYGARHPEMVKAQRQLIDIDAQIQAEVRRVASNLEVQASVARQRAASIGASLNASKRSLESANAASVRLNELKRNADSARGLYQSFLDRFKQTSAQQGAERTDARLVAHATVPTAPSFPNIPVTAVLALLAGIVSVVLSVLLWEAFDTGLYTGEDVERWLDAAAIGAIPTLATVTDASGRRSRSPTRSVVEHPFSVFAEAFRSLRTSILAPHLGAPVRTVVITSALPGEGKTVASICLGRIIALGGTSVLVVDCDLRRRAVNRLFAEEPAVGLLEVLAGSATLEQALVRDPASGAMFLPLAAAQLTPKNVFASPAMDSLLETLSQRFQVILLDTAPVLPLADTLVLAPKADATVFLVRWKRTPRKAVELALQQLEAAGAHLTGVALTQVDLHEQMRSGYGDRGYYARAYGAYYVDGPSLAGLMGRPRTERS